MGTDPKDTSGFIPDSGAGKAIISYAPSRFIEPLLGFLSLPVLTRILDVKEFGTFSIIILTASMLRTIGFDWIANCALRFRASMKDEVENFFSNIFTGLITSFATAFLFMFLIRGVTFTDSLLVVKLYIWWILADALFSALAYTGEMILRADQNPGAFTLSRMFQGLSRHVFGVGALFLSGGNLQAYFLARITGTLLTALWSWHLVSSPGNFRLDAVSWPTQRQFFIFGFPIALSIFANALRVMGNRYAVLWLDGPEATGLYSAAANIGGAPILVFQQIVMLGLYPLAIKNWEDGIPISPVVRDGLRYFFIIGIPALTGLAMLSRPIISFIAGPRYGEAWPVLSVIAGAMFIYGFSQYFSIQFLVEKRTWTMAAIGIAAGIFNLLLAILLIPYFGYPAAAFSLLASNLMLLAGLIFWGSGSLKDSIPARTSWNCVKATIPMGATIFAVLRFYSLDNPLALAGIVVLGLGIYTLVIWRTGEISNEINYLRGKFQSGFKHP